MELESEMIWVALGVLIGILMSVCLPNIKSIVGNINSGGASLEEDDGLFNDDEQIEIPPGISDGQADAALFEKYPV